MTEEMLPADPHPRYGLSACFRTFAKAFLGGQLLALHLAQGHVVQREHAKFASSTCLSSSWW